MNGPTIEELRQQLTAAEAEVDRLREALATAEWLRAFEGASEAS